MQSAAGKSGDKVSSVSAADLCNYRHTSTAVQWFLQSRCIIQRPRIQKTVAPQTPPVNRPKCAKTLQNDRRPFKSPHRSHYRSIVGFESCNNIPCSIIYARIQCARRSVFYILLLLLLSIGSLCYMRRVVCFQILYYNTNYTW